MVKVLNPLENVNTSSERFYSVCAELVRDLILGLIAGLLAAIQISMSANDAEVNAKLRGLKNWMTEKSFPKTFQVRERVVAHKAVLAPVFASCFVFLPRASFSFVLSVFSGENHGIFQRGVVEPFNRPDGAV